MYIGLFDTKILYYVYGFRNTEYKELRYYNSIKGFLCKLLVMLSHTDTHKHKNRNEMIIMIPIQEHDEQSFVFQ